MLTASQNTFLYFQSMWSSLLQFQQCFHFRKDLQLNPIPFITQSLLIHVISIFYYYLFNVFKSLTFLFRHKATTLFQDLKSTSLLYRQESDKPGGEMTWQELPGQAPTCPLAKLDIEIQLHVEGFLFFPTLCRLCVALYSPIYAIISKLLNHNDITYLSRQIFFC